MLDKLVQIMKKAYKFYYIKSSVFERCIKLSVFFTPHPSTTALQLDGSNSFTCIRIHIFVTFTTCEIQNQNFQSRK